MSPGVTKLSNGEFRIGVLVDEDTRAGSLERPTVRHRQREVGLYWNGSEFTSDQTGALCFASEDEAIQRLNADFTLMERWLAEHAADVGRLRG